MPRSDLLSECNAVGAPLDLFKEQCCNHCINPECSRSRFGESNFDVRVNTWYDRLFANVPRMDPHDPRFKEIAGQKFMTLDEPLIVTGGPSDWTEVPTDQSAKPPAPVAPEKTAPDPEPEPEPEKGAKEPEKQALEPPPSAPKPAQGQIPQHLVLANTPPQGGKLPSAPETQADTDAWSGPIGTPTTGQDRVVKPGERIKIGGSE